MARRLARLASGGCSINERWRATPGMVIYITNTADTDEENISTRRKNAEQSALSTRDYYIQMYDKLVMEDRRFFDLVKVEKIGRQVVVSLVDKETIGFPS